MAAICDCRREEAPTKSSETKETRMTEIVIARLRVRPLKVSEVMKRNRTGVLLQRSEP